MKSTVSYEWDYETVDDGDINDHSFRSSLSEFSESDKTDTLVLVRDILDANGGLQDRSWAYVVDGKLPVDFKDDYGNETAKVPERFHKELANYLSA